MRNGSTKLLKEKYVPTSEFYSQVIDSLQDYGIITMDLDLLINSWNSGATKLFGYEADEIIGNHISIIFNEEDNINNIPKIETGKAVNEGRATDNRWHLRKGGSKFFAFGLTFPLTGIDGEIMGFVKITRDLTEQKNAEEAIKKYVKELEELNTHKENILAILSHDLRNPLSTIIMAANLLKMSYNKMPEEEKMNLIDMIIRVSTNELQMFDYLLEWARIKYASDAFSPKQLDLNNSIKKVMETLRELTGTNEIRFINNVPENTHVYADEKMVFSILQNIITNAIKHSHGDIITISSTFREGMVVTKIEDNGVGLSEEAQQNIFTSQMNILSNARQGYKGGGIGLLLVKGFVEKNGGRVWVESTEGKGTSFYFSLPENKPDTINILEE